ncbi:simple sugar transport system ATP-binding protein [Paenibacillus sophorae]|uniref:ABC transporter ATP-binding protein n=1 Tax=Paenibacillus sophorae TaxID=1333845 RepID=A0A1H8KWS5_9BACL|nr:ABC transporter ATP-binding protein [Paenibacillus sophorae]QWU17531.1 ABC transporter ATP-binding protein [Paenibacillus sophorae]SEN97309.1 simple sugar transport system ATP-binding protein [Paenibacillus sophorae]
MQEYSVEMRGIVKRFGSVTASDQVDFSANAGEIHALLGENGAGKSTVMSMLSGVYRADEGEILIHGKPAKIRSPKDAAMLGVGMVFQNFRLVQTLTAAENIVLGEKSSFWRGRNWIKNKHKEIEELAERFGLKFPVDRPIWQLSVGEQQRVEIVKTLYRGADIIILDEPTSVLTPGEVEGLFSTLRRMKQEGKTVIMTTHKMKEVMASSDRISVMRKGKMIATLVTKDTDERELARLMVGREVVIERQEREATEGEELLDVKNLSVYADHGRKALDDLSLSVRKGEIVGVAGVAGNGQKELAEVLTGLRTWREGGIIFDGSPVKTASVRGAIDSGISHVPENRMKSGLAGRLGSVDNLLFKSYRSEEHSKFGFLKAAKNRSWSEELVRKFDVKTPELDTPVQHLSGGNQQKLLFAREVTHRPKLMVAVHPTQGLDVGATAGVHELLMDLRASGSGVLLISEDLDELLQLSDRILVIYNGAIIGEETHETADRERIGLMMAGIRSREESMV